MIRSWRSQPLVRSWAMRGAVAISAAPIAPNAAIEIMSRTASVIPLTGGVFAKMALNNRYMAIGMASIRMRNRVSVSIRRISRRSKVTMMSLRCGRSAGQCQEGVFEIDAVHLDIGHAVAAGEQRAHGGLGVRGAQRDRRAAQVDSGHAGQSVEAPDAVVAEDEPDALLAGRCLDLARGAVRRPGRPRPTRPAVGRSRPSSRLAA